MLRSGRPPPADVAGARVSGLRRLGKRIVLALEGELFIVIHLMIAGRLRWHAAGAKLPGKIGLAAFDFPTGTLLLTEAGTKRRASHARRCAAKPALAPFDRGGLEVLDGDVEAFARAAARARTTRSSARSPIRGCSAASATPTPTRSCTARGSRRSR